MPPPNSADTHGGGADEPRGGAGGEGGVDERPGLGEFATIARLARLVAGRGRGPEEGETWIGDDAAVLRPRERWMVLTTDLVVAGVHGDLTVMGVDDLGWRAFVASVSDVAAMGGRPSHAVVSVAAAGGADVEGLYEGIAAAAEEYDCPVVGGDLSGMGGTGEGPPLVVSVARTGEVADDPPPVRRSGARAGDSLFVTGPLGASAAGLRALRAGRGHDPLADAHRRPRARVAEGDAARRAGAGAMVDVSDGLVGDLGRLASASGVGFELARVPVAAGADPDDALGGGEDYELVIATARPDTLVEHFAAVGLRPPLLIGTCVADVDRRTLEGRPVPAGGWEHTFGPS
ncbi:MAG: thiamine-phosphate kinase [Acidobacteriota bacterium]|nr:thiamine-phosphate kinase [Acidobacteriota bacterium]